MLPTPLPGPDRKRSPAVNDSVIPSGEALPKCTSYWRTPDGQLQAYAACGRPAFHEVADTFVCDHHYRSALAWAEKAARWANSIVYYVQRSDRMIKIGTSRVAPTRLGDLAREHGPLVLMASQVGARAEESAMHRKFKALHVGREWFRPELPLLRHIAEVRKSMGNLEEQDGGLPPRMTRLELSRLIRQAQNRGAA